MGAVVGSLLTIAGQAALRVLREWGDVRIKVHAWEVTYPEGVNSGGTRTVNTAVPGYSPYDKNPEHYQSVTASYSISLELFNEKDLDTALQGIGVTFYKGNEVAAEGDLLDKDAPRRGLSLGDRMRREVRSHEDYSRPRRAEEFLEAPTTTVDLPSRRTVRLTLSGEIDGAAGLEVMRSSRVTLNASFPNGSRFSKEIAVLVGTSDITGDEWQLTVE
ncbi:hypothetical protein GBA63_09135 [Rubrobacter tropicus]|uniref:Uncharacterized protein n=1 Tax=Rubrobacter tropicus TaxID=2653851 RepID=A0A6G8Q8I1_9ACTN|nr:hypothetical protein [Rubrobacter tropicus]QIN82795.1 hypothetical protein GBA63_09135 [Rubrobacter tropicus]